MVVCRDFDVSFHFFQFPIQITKTRILYHIDIWYQDWPYLFYSWIGRDIELLRSIEHSRFNLVKISSTMNALRRKVLQKFKKLHRTRLRVFDGDERALVAARNKINEEFNKNKYVKDEDSIKAMIQFAEDVERELRTQIIQAREVKPGVFEAKITGDTLKLDNIMYNDSAVPDEAVRGQKPCCQDQAKNTQL